MITAKGEMVSKVGIFENILFVLITNHILIELDT